MSGKTFRQEIADFRGVLAPERGSLVGYGAILKAYDLDVPKPDNLSLISTKQNQKYSQDGWKVFGQRYLPEDSLYGQLVFALKYEGVNLLLLKKLFGLLSVEEVHALLQKEPQGQYSRRLWFLYEWLLDTKLEIPDLQIGNYVPLLDGRLQYALDGGALSSRHRIRNNLPGTKAFCPLIRKTGVLEEFIHSNLSEKQNSYLKGIRGEIMQRTSAFLLLKDSKASFTIEGESPKSKRTARWGQAIGQAGVNELSESELLRLQKIIIENDRFVRMGFRKEGGFVGTHDRTTGMPIPEHVSARWEDVEILMDGLIETSSLLVDSSVDAVLAAAKIAFGFVFIHPFVDGNGRLHRYLIHHVLAKKGFTQQGIIFPVSASILDRINDYRETLEAYSHPLLEFIDWEETPDHNVRVLNETIDYYRYFDATAQAEFLYSCVEDTIERIIPEEVKYLRRYDEFKEFIDEELEMPDKEVALLVRKLEQNNGKLSKRAKRNFFSALTEKEVEEIERSYHEIFLEEE